MRLVEILLERGWISPAKLRSLVGYQNLDDQQLGTGLLEEGMLTPDQLATALGVFFGVPPALDRDFARADPNLRKRLSAHHASNHKAVPLYTTPNRRVAVAMVNPTDPRSTEELGFVLGASIEPMATSEPVLARQLEQLYSMPRRWTTGYHPVASPFVAEGGRGTPAPMIDADRRPVNLSPLVVNADSRFEAATAPPRAPAKPSLPRRPPQPTLSYGMPMSDMPLFVPADPGSPARPAEDAMSQAPASSRVAITGPDAAVEQILSANDRQVVVDHLFGFMRLCFGAGAMFVVNGVFAQGRFGYNEGSPCPSVESVVFSLSLPSCFYLAHRQGVIFHGSPLPDGEAVHRPLWAALGCQSPREVVVAPVVVAGRTAILLYGQGRNGARIESFTVSRLERVSAALANVLVRQA